MFGQLFYRVWIPMYVGYTISTKKGFFTPTTIDNLVLHDTYAGYDYIEYMNVHIII